MKRIILASILLLSACLTTGAAQAFGLQNEIDNALPGATVNVPCGVFDIGDIVISSKDVWQKVVTIQGCGHGHLGQADKQGGAQWDYLLERGYYYGTVLRGTITLEKGTGTTPKVYFRDLSLIGFGDGVGGGGGRLVEVVADQDSEADLVHHQTGCCRHGLPLDPVGAEERHEGQEESATEAVRDGVGSSEELREARGHARLRVRRDQGGHGRPPGERRRAEDG